MGSKDTESPSEKKKLYEMVFEVTRRARLENKPILSDSLRGNAGSDAPVEGEDPKKKVFNVQMIATPNHQETSVLPHAGEPFSNVKQSKSPGDTEPKVSTGSSDTPELSSTADSQSGPDSKPSKGK